MSTKIQKKVSLKMKKKCFLPENQILQCPEKASEQLCGRIFASRFFRSRFVYYWQNVISQYYSDTYYLNSIWLDLCQKTHFVIENIFDEMIWLVSVLVTVHGITDHEISDVTRVKQFLSPWKFTKWTCDEAFNIFFWWLGCSVKGLFFCSKIM